MNTLLQLETMDYSKVKLVCCDDIYYENHKFELLPIFRAKGKNNYQILLEQANIVYINNPYHISDLPIEY